jgi:hypothetical protein
MQVSPTGPAQYQSRRAYARPKVSGPVPDGFVRDGDAALREDVFDVSEAQGEAVVEPDRVADNRGREPVAGIADGIVGHPTTLPAVASS